MAPTRRALSLLTWTALFTLLSLLMSPVAARKKMLIYTYTQGFRHYSIPTATKVVQQLAEDAQPRIDTVHSEDPSDFERKNWLSQFDMVMFISVSGKALSDDGADALREYIEAGGGYLGVHEACDALYQHHWYGRLVGAYFNYHPQITHATLNVINQTHPATAHLKESWRVYDEMYNYNSDPSKWGKQYLITADQSSYNDPVETTAQRAQEQGNPHPIAWWKEGNQLSYNPHVKVGGGTDPTKQEIRSGKAGTGGQGRSFYTALGHTNSMWHDDDFQQHIMGAVSWLMESPVLRSSSPNPPKGAVGSDYVAPDISANVTVGIGPSRPDSGPGISSTLVGGTPVPYSKSAISKNDAASARSRLLAASTSSVALAVAVGTLMIFSWC
ncbi:ThuA domain-containing protein [Pseudozyma hubeiensis]|nr:ThuA domain-containing protein [Pseudozyma hubeiensis]